MITRVSRTSSGEPARKRRSGAAAGRVACLLALMLAGWPGPGQAGGGDSLDVGSIAHAEVSQAALDALRSVLDEAEAAGLPAEPLVTKFLEGIAKGVPEARVMAAVRAVRARLERAARIMEEAVALGAAGPLEGADVARVAAGLSAGVPPDQVRGLAEAVAEGQVPISKVAVAVGTLERLRAMGVYEEVAALVLGDALSSGVPAADIRRLAEDFRRHAQAGGDPASFFGAPRPDEWHEDGLSESGLWYDVAGRIGSGRLPDEGGGGESVVPGTDRIGRDREDDADPYRDDRPDPREEIDPDLPGGEDPRPGTPEPLEP